ncbi:MAG: CARDB domain-containing protein [Candidatus Magasanikbacteria bacterium]
MKKIIITFFAVYFAMYPTVAVFAEDIIVESNNDNQSGFTLDAVSTDEAVVESIDFVPEEIDQVQTESLQLLDSNGNTVDNLVIDETHEDSTTSSYVMTPNILDTVAVTETIGLDQLNISTTTEGIQIEEIMTTSTDESTEETGVLNTIENVIETVLDFVDEKIVEPVQTFFVDEPTPEKLQEKIDQITHDNFYPVDDYTEVAYLGNGKNVYRMYTNSRLKYWNTGLHKWQFRGEDWNWFFEQSETQITPEKGAKNELYSVPFGEYDAMNFQVGKMYYNEKEYLEPNILNIKNTLEGTSNVAHISDVYPDVDIKFTDSERYRQKAIIIKKPLQNIVKGSQVTFWENVQLPKGGQVYNEEGKILTGKLDVVGDITIKDGNGFVFTISDAIYFDASVKDIYTDKGVYPVKQVVEVNDGLLRIGLSLDTTYLLNKNRVYPITIDPNYSLCREGAVSPGYNVFLCTIYNMDVKAINGARPLVSTERFNMDEIIRVGKYWDNGTQETKSFHGILYFSTDFPSLQGNVVTSASLKMYYRDFGPGTDNVVNLSASRITQAWNYALSEVQLESNYSYNTFRNSADESSSVSVTSNGNQNRWFSFDITNMTSKWFLGTASHRGILVQPSGLWLNGNSPPASWASRLLYFKSSRSADNTSPYLEVITSNGQPDLAIQQAFTDRNEYSPGEQVNFTMDIINQGNTSTGANGIVSYYISDICDWENDYIDNDSFPSLNVNQVSTETSSYVIPEGTLSNVIKYYCFYVDSNRSIGESNENNNKEGAPFVVRDTRRPDFTITNPILNSGANVIPLQDAQISYSIDNIGQGNQLSEAMIYYRFTPGSADYGAPYVDDSSFFSLDPNDDALFRNLNYTIPTSTIPGTYYLSVFVDGDNTIAEENENNNKYAFQVNVLGAQDLDPTQVTINNAGTKYSGQTISTNVTLRNDGNIAANNIQYRLNLKDINNSNNVYTLTNISPISVNLGVNMSSTFTLTGTIPENVYTSGRYQLEVVIDPNNSISEINEGNNTRASVENIYIESYYIAPPEQGGENIDTDEDGIVNVTEAIVGSDEQVTTVQQDASHVYSAVKDTTQKKENDLKDKNSDGDPVNIRTGSFEHTQIDLSIPGRGVDFDITRVYNSKIVERSGRFGNGWTFSYNQYSYQDPTTKEIIVYKAGTQIAEFATNDAGQTFVTAPGETDKLYWNEGQLVLEKIDGTKYIYGNIVVENFILLSEITDTNGNIFRYNYTDIRGVPMLTSVTDPSGRTITFTYGVDLSEEWDKIKRIEVNWDAENIRTIDYTYDEELNLVSVDKTIVQAGITTHEIDSFTHDVENRIATHTDPRGTILYNEYDDLGRVTVQYEHNPSKDEVETKRRIYDLAFTGADIEVPASSYCSITKEYNTEGSVQERKVCFDENHLRIFSSDKDGNSMKKMRNAEGMVVAEIDQNNLTTTYEYDNERRVIRTILPDTERWHTEIHYIYGSFNRVTEKREIVTDLQNPISPAIERVTSYTIDPANGNVLSVTDPMGFVESYTYDQYGNVLTHTEKNGNTTTYTYDANGNYRLTETKTVHLVDGTEQIIRKTYTYDVYGNRTSYTDPEGNRYTYAYDNQNNLVREVNPVGGIKQYEYDIEGHRTAILDEMMRRTQYVYDTNITASLLQTIRVAHNGDHIITSSTYDNIGRLVGEMDGNGNLTSYVYDESGRMTQTITPVLTTTYTYDAKGNVVREENSAGQKTEYVYDTRNNLRETKQYTGVDTYISTLSTYDGFDRLIATTDPNGNTTQTIFDNNDRTTYVIDALGNTVQYFYDNAGNKVGELSPRAYIDPTLRNANGHSTTSVYDEANRLIKTINAQSKETWYWYNKNGQITKVIDRQNTDGTKNEHVTQYVYDQLGRKTEEIDAYGNKATFAYDNVGNLETSTDVAGVMYTYTYDEFNRLIDIMDSRGGTTRNSYDKNGNKLSETVLYPDNTTTSYIYDSVNRVTQITDALGNTRNYTYDAIGNLLTEQNGRGYITTFTYDKLGRRISEINTQGTVTTYVYDNNGNRTSENIAGKITGYTYDVLGRVKQVMNPGNKLETYTYDQNSNILTKTDGEGQVTTYTYDSLERPLTKTLSDNSLVTSAYDNWDNTTLTAVPEQTVTYEYDYKNRNTVENITLADLSEQTKTLTRTYWKNNNVRTLSDGINTTEYVYDGKGELVYVNVNGIRLATYVYYAYGSPRKITYANGFVTDFTYDATQRLTLQTITNPMNEVVWSHEYDYDAENNRTEVTEKGERTIRYTYDNLNQLKTVDYANTGDVVDQGYNYDVWGNRTSYAYDADNTTYTYTPNTNELSNYAVNGILNVVNIYNNNGNITQEVYTRGNDPLRTVGYTWDIENNLKQITYTDNSRPAFLPQLSQNTLTFAYDNNGNRIKKTVNNTDTTYYINNGLRVYSELNQNGQTTKTNIYGIDQIAEINNTNQEVTYIHTDILGSTILLTNTNSEIIGEYEYEPFGNTIGYQGTKETNSLFTNQEKDQESELYYYNARYYNPNLGRFIERDSYLGQDGQTLSKNRYIYVQNNPLKFVDPTGEIEDNTLKDKQEKNEEHVQKNEKDLAKVGLVFYGANPSIWSRPQRWGQSEFFYSMANQWTNQKKQEDTSIEFQILDGSTTNAWISALNNNQNIHLLAYFGHGYETGLTLNDVKKTYIVSDNDPDYNSTKDIKVSSLPKQNIWKYANIYLFSCNASSHIEGGSIAQAFANHFGVPVFGARGGVSFDGDNDNPVIRDKHMDEDVPDGESGWEWNYKDN